MRPLADLKLELANRAETWLTTNLPGLWQWVEAHPQVHKRVNALLIDRTILKIPVRPNPLSTLAAYTSWASLTDRTYDSRHLPPVERPRSASAGARGGRGPLHPAGRDGAVREVDACSFAVLRAVVHRRLPAQRALHPDRATRGPQRLQRTRSTCCRSTGCDAAVTRELRSHEGGQLKTQEINGEEFPPYLFDGGRKPVQRVTVVRDEQIPPEQRRQLFAFGSDTGNLQVGFVMMNVLFAARAQPHRGRSPSRLPRLGRRAAVPDRPQHPHRDPDQDRDRGVHQPHHAVLLQAARPTRRRFSNERWYRQNWMAIEFNLLYRWHGLVPSELPRSAGADEPIWQTRSSTRRWSSSTGSRRCSRTPRSQRAGRVGLLNTAPGAARGRARQRPRGARRGARALQRLPRAREVPARDGASTRSRATAASRTGCASSTAASTGSSSTRACSPRTSAPNSVLPSLIGRMVASTPSPRL